MVQDQNVVNRLTLLPGESPTHGLHFWEPVIDGRPLRHILDETPEDEPTPWGVSDNVPVLVHNWPVGLLDDVFVLLGQRPPELASGRIPLFVCPACGDLGCGAITAAVEWTTDTVVWRDFGWDVDYETDGDEDEDFVSAGPFVFERVQYEAELRRFVETFDQVRASLPARLAPPTRDAGGRWRRWWRPFG